MMGRNICLILFMWLTPWVAMAQHDYLVTTQDTAQVQTPASSGEETAEEDFISTHFKHYSLCEWTPGMKFMVIPERKDLIIPAFRDGETHREANSGTLKHRIFEYLGSEVTDRGSLRFHFDCEGKAYYHEVRNTTLEAYCLKPKAGIPTLAYLNDVDIAREVLMGSTLYMRTTKVRVDDPSSPSGYREASIPMNEKVTVTAIGVGTRAFPVKIVFTDTQGNTYYQPVAISLTNSGMTADDFIMDNKNKHFSHSFSFRDANEKASEILMSQYGDKTIYLKQEAAFMDIHHKSAILPRYTHFVVRDIQADGNSPFSTLSLSTEEGQLYKIKACFKQTTIGIMLQSDNYFGDLFGIGNLKTRYPYISHDQWKVISEGEVRKGMTTNACRLAMGDPIRIHKTGLNEVWYYQRRSLYFYDKKLERIDM